MSQEPPYYAVLDSNVWVTERLAQTTMGSALLYALTSSGALIGLPQVVEMEVNHVLDEHGEKAVETLRKNVQLLRQLSGQPIAFATVPSRVAIRKGIAERWDALSGLVKRIPFTYEHALSALDRIIQKAPPCGENNEQFRDCCIWEAALDLAGTCMVHIVTKDSSFYEGRDHSRGMARVLRDELERKGREVRIHPTVRDLLAVTDKAVTPLDEAALAAGIVDALRPKAKELAAEPNGEFELGPPSQPRIKGYTTPKPSVVAVSFEVRYPLTRLETNDGEQRQVDAVLLVSGVCSYDPGQNSVSEVEVREWSKRLPGYERSWTDRRVLERRYGPGQTRFIE
jgi:hypothetical protein